MKKIILVIPAFFVLIFILGFGAPKAFAHIAAYKMGLAEGRLWIEEYVAEIIINTAKEKVK